MTHEAVVAVLAGFVAFLFLHFNVAQRPALVRVREAPRTPRRR